MSGKIGSFFGLLTLFTGAFLTSFANAGVIASLGPLTQSGTTLSADISLDFTNDLLNNDLLQLVSFDLINSNSSLGPITDFSGFAFTPSATFSLPNWLDASFITPNRIELISLTGGDLISGSVVVGTLTFDYSTLSSSFGQPGDFVTLDITGTTELVDPDGVTGPLPESLQPTSAVIFNEPLGNTIIPFAYENHAPGSQTFSFGGSGNNPVPEPSSIGVFLLLGMGISRIRTRR